MQIKASTRAGNYKFEKALKQNMVFRISIHPQSSNFWRNALHAGARDVNTVESVLTLQAIYDFPINDKIDEEYVRSFMEWDNLPRKRDAEFKVERYARLRAIKNAELWPYYKELIRPQVEANRERLIKEYEEWEVSEDYQWLRNYLLSNTDGDIKEIEALINPLKSTRLNDLKIPHERYANWLWNTRHYFGLTHDLETVLEMGAIAQKIEYPDM